MTRLDQAYVTHCTFHTSLYHQESFERGGDRTYEYTTRAGSFDRTQGLSFYQKFRSVAYYKNYRREGFNDDALRELTHADFPIRFAFLPEMGGNDLLIHACYRGFDTSKTRRAQCFFVHLLYHDRSKPGTAPILTARQVLPLWNSSAWIREDSNELTYQLPTFEQISAFAKPATDDFERTLLTFATAPSADRIVDPQRLIPDRWKNKSTEARQDLLRSVLRGYLGVSMQNRVSLVVAAEPEFAAFLFFAVARLIPQKGFGAQISFSTFELTGDSFFPAKLVATTSEAPEKTEFQNRTGGPVINCFSEASPIRPVGKESLFEKSIFYQITHRQDDWIARLDMDLVHIENAAPNSPDELDGALRCVKTIQSLLRPREDMVKADIVLPESKEDRAFVTRAIAPRVSELFSGDSLLQIAQQPSLLETYMVCLEESKEPLTQEASHALGSILDGPGTVRYCDRKRLAVETRLEILCGYLMALEGDYSRLFDALPLEKPLAERGKPLADELFTRLPPTCLPKFIKSIHENKSGSESFLVLAKGLSCSGRSDSEKQAVLRHIFDRWTKVGTLKNDSAESRMSKLLLECVREIDADTKVKFISAGNLPDDACKRFGNSIGELFLQIVACGQGNAEFSDHLGDGLQHVLHKDDPDFTSLVDRLAVTRALAPGLPSGHSLVDEVQDYCRHLVKLKLAADNLNSHRQTPPTTFGKKEYLATAGSLERRVIEAAKQIIQFVNTQEIDPDDPYGSYGRGEYEITTRHATAIKNLANIYNAGLESGELIRELRGQNTRSGRTTRHVTSVTSGLRNLAIGILLGAAIAGGAIYKFVPLLVQGDPAKPTTEIAENSTGPESAGGAHASGTQSPKPNDVATTLDQSANSGTNPSPTGPNTVQHDAVVSATNTASPVSTDSKPIVPPQMEAQNEHEAEVSSKPSVNEEARELSLMEDYDAKFGKVADQQVPLYLVQNNSGQFTLPKLKDVNWKSVSWEVVGSDVMIERVDNKGNEAGPYRIIPSNTGGHGLIVFSTQNEGSFADPRVIVATGVLQWKNEAAIVVKYGIEHAYFGDQIQIQMANPSSVVLQGGTELIVAQLTADEAKQCTDIDWRKISSFRESARLNDAGIGEDFQTLESSASLLENGNSQVKVSRFELVQSLYIAFTKSPRDNLKTAVISDAPGSVSVEFSAVKTSLKEILQEARIESTSTPDGSPGLTYDESSCLEDLSLIASRSDELHELICDDECRRVAEPPSENTELPESFKALQNTDAAARFIQRRAMLALYLKERESNAAEDAEQAMESAFAKLSEHAQPSKFAKRRLGSAKQLAVSEKLLHDALNWNIVKGILKTEQPKEVRELHWKAKGEFVIKIGKKGSEVPNDPKH